MCGIISDKTRSRLLREADLTLETAINICRANEATVTQMKMLGESNTTSQNASSMEIDAIDTGARSDTKKQYCDKCGNCGNWHKKQQRCPAQGVECHKCGKRTTLQESVDLK